METITEKMAVIFKTLEDKCSAAEQAYHAINRQYEDICKQREEAYNRWKLLERMFAHADVLQGLIESEEETSE